MQISIPLPVRLLLGAGLLGCRAGETAEAQSRAAPFHVTRQLEKRFPLLSDEETWQRLPEAEAGSGAALPQWARALASSLPRTTAAMLELDWLHRTSSPLDPNLRGMMRWTVAHANRCDYSEACVVADLCRAGLAQSEVEALRAQRQVLPEPEQAAINFSRKLTLAADTVTDEEVARLIGWYGDKQLAAMVLLVAHANFQDRLFLSLGLDMEPNGSLPPVPVRFAKEQSKKAIVLPERKKLPNRSENTDEVATIEDPDWLGADFSTLQSKLEAQRDRPGRIRVPTWEEVQDWLPDRARRDDPLRIKWSLVCVGYQPELALAWSACMRAFADEAKQDRVFEECLFWVITRTIRCFY